MTTIELRQKRAKIIAECHALNDKVLKEGRTYSAEENQQYDRAWGEAEALRVQIERMEQLEAEEKRLAQPTAPAMKPEPEGAQQQTTSPRATEEYRTAYRRFLAGGVAEILPEERRALQADNASLGGYLVTPQQFVTDLLKAVDDAVTVRKFATIHRLEKAESLGVPVLDTDVSDPDWTSELATGNEDSAMKFGKRELRPHPLAKRIKISQKLLRSSVLDVEALVRDRLAYKFGIAQEKAHMTGDGAQKPLGIFVASANGISTARDVSTDNTTTAMTFKGLQEAKYALKGQYWPRARWIFHRDALKQIAKIQDATGRPIWSESVRVGEPDRLLNLPVHVSEYAPNTFTAGQYVGILGDFSFYWIADALDIAIQRLVELYAETNQIGFIGRLETDGMPVLEEAFVRIQLAAS